MADSDNSLPPSKKRAAGRELSKENPGLDDDESSEQETGTFKRASEEVLASRRIVKVRRQQPTLTPSPPSSNPFAGICLVPPADVTPALVSTEAESGKTVAQDTEEKGDTANENEGKSPENGKPSEIKLDEQTEESTNGEETSVTVEQKQSDDATAGEKTASEAKEDAEVGESESETKKDGEDENTEEGDKKDRSNDIGEQSAVAKPFSPFQFLSSSQNAFTGLAGTGFSSSSFSFGVVSKEGSPPGLGSGSIFGANNGNVSLFGGSGTSTVNKSEGFPSLKEVPVETGEENEKPIFTADSVLFEFLDGGWKERGKGELKLNISTTGTGKARLIMRSRGNYRLILNAYLYPDMKLTNMDKKGITFACVNSAGEGKTGLSTFALKFKDPAILEELRGAIMLHKGETAVASKTPENSPKASDD